VIENLCAIALPLHYLVLLVVSVFDCGIATGTEIGFTIAHQ
jgi:hypothetical protein